MTKLPKKIIKHIREIGMEIPTIRNIKQSLARRKHTDPRQCNNYKGIILLNANTKIY